MCEADVYISRNGKEEIVMEKVDRIVPGEDNNIFMESIFGERRVVKARIKEMELVHHRVVLEELTEAPVAQKQEIWLEPDTDHGHFHSGEEVRLKLFKGYNMRPSGESALAPLQAFVHTPDGPRELEVHQHHEQPGLVLGEEEEGLVQVYVKEQGDEEAYAKLIIEVGHHHHHQPEVIGLPLEIVPINYSHARLGENYEIQVLTDGKPLAGAEVKATFSSTSKPDYPHRLVTDESGKTRLFLSARGNYLFSVSHEKITSTFTLVKAY